LFSPVILGLLMAMPSASSELIVLNYYERPPFMVGQPDGSAAGLTADPAAALFKKAGVPFRWQRTPAKRQLSEIESGAGYDCGIGWFGSVERADTTMLVGPIYRDKPPVILAGPGYPIDSAKPIDEQLADRKSPVLIKDGLTYGSYITRLIRDAQLNTMQVSVEQAQMVTMLAAGRANLMFSTREEADMLLSDSTQLAEKVHAVALGPDAVGEDRYLLCSSKIDEKIIAALRAALAR